ncbi:putative paraoxonase [Talaromyces proteolyticus]|uniref:Paraoxonase n=1 Tax=Talaromyces proteolyticus TaxID=1131652 RepID=A0AAD4Q3U1_9EURO|nr:putative paraoxonase [Talaromyces proteolyticus]KAH8702158.1 putative paraoxonase [Talaromyces proteolyticus]
MGLSFVQAFGTIAIVSFPLVFLHRLLSPWVELPRLPEQWLAFRSGLAWTLFKDRVGFSEDVVLDHEYGFAIISTDPGRVFWNTLWGQSQNPRPKGRLLLYDYAGSGGLQELKLVGFPSRFDLRPLGLNFFRADGSNWTRLFVVNYGGGRGTVEIMDIDYEHAQATYVTTISDESHTLRSPNSVSPVSYTSFYVTNDHYLIRRKHPVLSFTETILGLPLGWVTFVDFTFQVKPTCAIAAGGIPFANGIIVTPTGKEVLVASSSTDFVRIYERDPETNSLSGDFNKVYLTFHPDNLSFDGSLALDDPSVFDQKGKFLRGVIVAGSPDAGRLFCMAKGPYGCVAPSVVAEIRRGHGPDLSPFPGSLFNLHSKYYARTLYADDGTNYPSSTSGDMDSRRGRLIISGLYADGLLDITWDPRENVA